VDAVSKSVLQAQLRIESLKAYTSSARPMRQLGDGRYTSWNFTVRFSGAK